MIEPYLPVFSSVAALSVGWPTFGTSPQGPDMPTLCASLLPQPGLSSRLFLWLWRNARATRSDQRADRDAPRAGFREKYPTPLGLPRGRAGVPPPGIESRHATGQYPDRSNDTRLSCHGFPNWIVASRGRSVT